MIKSLVNISGKHLLLPLYHTVSDKIPAHLKHLYPVRTVKQFKSDLEYILKYYKPVNIADLLNSVDNKQTIRENQVLFTFDDGLREVKEIIAPILKRKGIPAVFFINPAFVDNKNIFFRYKASLLVEALTTLSSNNKKIEATAKVLGVEIKKIAAIKKSILNINYLHRDKLNKIADVLKYNFDDYLMNQKPYLTMNELKELQRDGFNMGAHSTDHPEFFNISVSEQLSQTINSIIWVKDQLSPKYNLFAFPFTDFNVSKRFFETVFSDKNLALDLSFGCAGIKDEEYARHLQRVPFEKSKKSARKIITCEYLSYIGKKAIGKNKIKRKY